MRITLESTQDNKRSVAIEVESDHLSLDEMLDDLIHPILNAYGYIFDGEICVLAREDLINKAYEEVCPEVSA